MSGADRHDERFRAAREGVGASSTTESPDVASPSKATEAPPQREAVIEALKTVYDPEIPVDIYELGLVYEVEATDGGEVTVRMTLTSPMCPVAGSLPGEVEERVAAVPGVTGVVVDLVWDPPWNPSMMSEVARLELGM